MLNLTKKRSNLSRKSFITTLLLYAQVWSVLLIYSCTSFPLLLERNYEESRQTNLRNAQLTIQRSTSQLAPINLLSPAQNQQQGLYLPPTSWPQSSQNQKKNLKNSNANAFEPILVNSDHPLSASMFEGSGAGPNKPNAGKQQTKFDDTEGDDDNDEDDEDDYDDKDSLDIGSGLGNDSSNLKKSQSSETPDKNFANRLNESESFYPFRPSPPEVMTSVMNFQNRTPTTQKPIARQPTLPGNLMDTFDSLSNINILKHGFDNQNQTSSPNLNEFSNSSSDVLLTAPRPSTTKVFTTVLTVSQDDATKSTNIFLSNTFSTTFRPKLVAPIVPIAAPIPSLGLSSSRYKNLEFNSSTVYKPNVSTSLLHNYDYEDEWEDEEPEESESTFEDNDFSLPPAQSDDLNKTTTTNMTYKPSTTSSPTLNKISFLNATAKPTSTPQAQTTEPASVTSLFLNYTPTFSYVTTSSRPLFETGSSIPPIPAIDGENSFAPEFGEDGDNEEDEDEEDEDDEETINNDEYEDSFSEMSVSSVHRPKLATPGFQTTTVPPTSRQPSTIISSTTVSAEPEDDDDADDDDDDDDEEEEDLESHTVHNDYVHFTRPSASSTTSTPRLYEQLITTKPSVAVDTSQQQINKPVPFFTSSEPTTSPITNYLPIETTVIPAIATTAKTEFKYETTPKLRASQTLSKVPNTPIHIKDEEADLTTQLYEKVVEVYQATNKAIQAALELVWPPTFELNSSTFEPLIAQPLLFMMTLGAAVIGLVLTMMLIVYIVSYQIQPKDDDISIYM